MHGHNVDSLLDDFKADIVELICYYREQNRKTKYLPSYYYMMALYKFKHGNNEDAIHNTLQALVASDSFKDIAAFRKCVALFEAHRDLTSEGQKQLYNQRMVSILKEEFANEKSHYLNIDRPGAM